MKYIFIEFHCHILLESMDIAVYYIKRNLSCYQFLLGLD